MVRSTAETPKSCAAYQLAVPADDNTSVKIRTVQNLLVLPVEDRADITNVDAV